MESHGGPIQNIRADWDDQVDFWLADPGFYMLMYGEVQPGHSPDAQSRPSRILHGITAEHLNRTGPPSRQTKQRRTYS